MDTNRIDKIKQRTHSFIDHSFNTTEKVINQVRQKGKQSAAFSEATIQKLRDEAQHLKQEISDLFEHVKDSIPTPSDFASAKDMQQLKKRVNKIEKRLSAKEVEDSQQELQP